MGNEIWKDIPGYEGYYQVSNHGNVRSMDREFINSIGRKCFLSGVPIKPKLNKGYLRVGLKKHQETKRASIHRLVAAAFIDNPKGYDVVNHINGIKTDNRVENLEWCTQSENELHSHNVLNNTMKGKTYPKKVICIDENITFSSMLETIKWIGGTSCIEGLKKAIKANRLYHNHKFQFI